MVAKEGFGYLFQRVCRWLDSAKISSHLYIGIGTAPIMYESLFPLARPLAVTVKLEQSRLANHVPITAPSLRFHIAGGCDFTWRLQDSVTQSSHHTPWPPFTPIWCLIFVTPITRYLYQLTTYRFWQHTPGAIYGLSGIWAKIRSFHSYRADSGFLVV